MLRLQRGEKGDRFITKDPQNPMESPKKSSLAKRKNSVSSDRQDRDVVPPAETSLSPRGGAKHRTLKKEILTSLASAGEGGLTVEELSEKLGVLKSRIQSWFSGTGKRTEQLEKVAPGRWRHK